MDLISHGSWLFDLIDQSGPLPFLDPVSCVVTELRNSALVEKSFTFTPTARDWSLANCLSFTFFVFYLIIHFTASDHHFLCLFGPVSILKECESWRLAKRSE